MLFLHFDWKSLTSIVRTADLNSHSCLLQWQKSPEHNYLGWGFSCPFTQSLPKHNVFCPQLTERAWVSENRASALPESVTASKYIQWDPRTTSHFGKMLLLFLWSIVFFRVAQLCLLCTIPNKLIDVEGKPGKSLLHPTLRVPRSKMFNNCPDGEYIFSFLFLYILLLQIALLLGRLQAVDFILQLVTLCIVSHLPHCSGNATSELLPWNVPVNGNKGSIWILWLTLATHTHTQRLFLPPKWNLWVIRMLCVQPWAVMTFVLYLALVGLLYNHHRLSLRFHTFLGYMTSTEIRNRFRSMSTHW